MWSLGLFSSIFFLHIYKQKKIDQEGDSGHVPRFPRSVEFPGSLAPFFLHILKQKKIDQEGVL